MLTHLDELLNVSLVNLDDESVAVGQAWAQAIGKAVNSSIVVQNVKAKEAGVNAAKREVEDEEADNDKTKVKKRTTSETSSGISLKFQLRKGAQAGEIVEACRSTHAAINFLTAWFCKVGGDNSVGLGATYGVGGRLIRQQIGAAISHVLRLQVSEGTLLKCGSTLSQTVSSILSLCHARNFDSVRLAAPSLSSTGAFPSRPSSSNNMLTTPSSVFRNSTSSSSANNEAKVALAITSFVVRSGIGSQVSEPMQVRHFWFLTPTKLSPAILQFCNHHHPCYHHL